MTGAKNRLDGKVVIVTGAGMGMGAATAQVCAGYGAKVIVSDINEAAATRNGGVHPCGWRHSACRALQCCR